MKKRERERIQKQKHFNNFDQLTTRKRQFYFHFLFYLVIQLFIEKLKYINTFL
jgi:hypothetical protein